MSKQFQDLRDALKLLPLITPGDRSRFFSALDLGDLCALLAAHDRLEAEVDELKARYGTLRRLNPRQFTDLFNRNLAGEPFDSMVDEMSKETP